MSTTTTDRLATPAPSVPIQSGRAGETIARRGGAGHQADSAIVGHRLPGGYMSVHAPGQPCDYCDDAALAMASSQQACATKAAPGSPGVKQRQRAGRVGVIRSLRARVGKTAVLAVPVLALAATLGTALLDQARPIPGL